MPWLPQKRGVREPPGGLGVPSPQGRGGPLRRGSPWVPQLGEGRGESQLGQEGVNGGVRGGGPTLPPPPASSHARPRRPPRTRPAWGGHVTRTQAPPHIGRGRTQCARRADTPPRTSIARSPRTGAATHLLLLLLVTMLETEDRRLGLGGLRL